nr:hypothetical protein [Candidatus Sigynarchaeota archaeon]
MTTKNELDELKEIRKKLESKLSKEQLAAFDVHIANLELSIRRGIEVEHWASLHAASYYQPRSMRIDNGHEQLIKHSYDILIYAAETLLAQGKILHPVISGPVRFIINEIPFHRDGISLFVCVKLLSNGMYAEAHWDFVSMIRKADVLLEKFGKSRTDLTILDVNGRPIVPGCHKPRV